MQAFMQSKMEAGTQLAHAQGRPDIRGILKQMQKEHSNVSEIHVHAAGMPYGMHCTMQAYFLVPHRAT